ncbi:DNA topoisomerase I [Abyssibacter profundi]|uniref:DNA topoisomerase 1 n=1 Tax=Abyssibacter profundi TaxID=2182787 RepID=A0A383XRM5_9GAMM|nr:DNA topoisomerase I [Abyssibacter profundi]PWN55279.1 DNA topoisomerase I [Abyssibacter profundi]
MAQNLVIVESPAKAKTIEKYLGKDFRVLASYGHVRDLVPKEGAVDPSADFAMRYQVIDRNEKHVKTIVDALKKADALLLATDPDREGEAIAWHLLEILKEKGLLDDKTVQRVVFHEITERAIQDALSHPRTVSDDLVDAQQARRALDYLVGFNLSPLLWRKVQRGLSAGRVQSPALRLIVEREDEIDQFVPREYWSMEAQVQKDGQAFGSKLWTYAGDKVEQFTFTNEVDAHAARDALTAAAGGQLTAETVEKKQRRRNPAPPFTTSTLQQEASRKLGFTTTRTMRTAQQLYEGIEIDGSSIGLITYMRTDSVSLANDALAEMREVIADRYGNKALPDKPRQFKTKSKNAQEAHEAVRPTSATRHPSEMRKYLNSDQAKLYELIWKRAMASQMQPALYDTVSLTLTAGDGHSFRATGSTLVEPGFIAVYQEGRDDSKADDDDKTLPPVEQGDVLELLEVKTDQHFTEPPPRYTEASLVKTLEEYDIGRPSTYASIISTLLSREYVELESKRFYPTDIGRIVTRFLTEHFTQYVDYDFTARLEDELDAVSRGEKDWKPLLEGFWEPFSETVESKQDISRAEVAQARELGTDPKSGKPVIVRIGRYGPFAQIGSKDDEDKPKFASLRPGQRLDKITLDEALALFQLPRDMGETPEGEEMQVAVGRFGPYVRYGKKFASLGKDDDPYTVSRERCLELVAAKKKLDAEREIHVWEDEGIKVLNGRYGPYITDGKKNAKIPKDTDPKSLTLEQCQELIAAAPERKKRGGRKTTTKAASKSTTKSTSKAKKKA